MKSIYNQSILLAVHKKITQTDKSKNLRVFTINNQVLDLSKKGFSKMRTYPPVHPCCPLKGGI